MKTETAQDLLEAVGVEWREKYFKVVCPECEGERTPDRKRPYHLLWCRRPDTSHIEPTYTGPALGTPELDAILLVAGQRWLREKVQRDKYFLNSFEWNVIGGIPENYHSDWCTWLLSASTTPGHALARAIREVGHA
jgi:hypothetical protein